MDNLHMTVSGNMVSVGWEMGGARFHVWLQIDRSATLMDYRHGVPVKPYAIRPNRHVGSHGNRFEYQIFKNPPLSIPYGGEGYFKTRYLDATAKAHAATVDKALREAERLGLYQQAVNAREAQEQAREEARTDAQADAAKRALRQLMDEGALGSGLIQQYLDGADRDSLARLYVIVSQTNARP